MATTKEILARHASYYEALMEHSDKPSVDTATVAAAILALIEVTPEVELTKYSDEKEPI
jgi:hypothetical protein